MPRYWQILEVARVTINTLEKIGIAHCCFIGGMACKLYTKGQGRQPMDLDILCFTTYDDAESIKRQLCEEDDRFYTVRARSPGSWWKILYWRTGSSEVGFEKFKIDILLPGTLDLPDIQPRYIIKANQLPCAPLALLLLHKLQAWDHRRRSRRQDQLDKLHGDFRNIADLLRIANKLNLNVAKSKPYISSGFRAESYRRVVKFCEEYPECKGLWQGLGLADEL